MRTEVSVGNHLKMPDRITQGEAGRRSGVSRTVVCEIEAGTRAPSLSTYELAICAVIGLTPLLADLADACGTSIPAVREGLLAIAPRLAAVGLCAADDGVRVEVAPLCAVKRAVAAITAVLPVGAAQRGAAGDHRHRRLPRHRHPPPGPGVARRRQRDLLRRLVDHGLLEKVADEHARGGPNIYPVSTRAWRPRTSHPGVQPVPLDLVTGGIVDLDRRPATDAGTSSQCGRSLPARSSCVNRW
jgi:DNA-binding XRE family transcriptional regulator